MAKSRRRNGKRRSFRKRGGMPKSTKSKSTKSTSSVNQTTSFKPTPKTPWSREIDAKDNGKNVKFTLEDTRGFSHAELEEKILIAFERFQLNAAELQNEVLFTNSLEPVNRLGEIYVYIVGPDPTLEWDGDDIVVNSRISKKHFLVKKNTMDEFNAQCIYFFELPIKFSSRPLSFSNMQAVDG